MLAYALQFIVVNTVAKHYSLSMSFDKETGIYNVGDAISVKFNPVSPLAPATQSGMTVTLSEGNHESAIMDCYKAFQELTRP